MCGNEKDAALALTGMLPMFDAGTTRDVYLINGVIYKVINDARYYTANADELAFGEYARDLLPKGVRIPDMAMYGDVLACEYINGEPTGECIDVAHLGLECSHEMTCIDPVVMESLAPFFRDPSWGNAIRVDSILYLVDVA